MNLLQNKLTAAWGFWGFGQSCVFSFASSLWLVFLLSLKYFATTSRRERCVSNLETKNMSWFSVHEQLVTWIISLAIAINATHSMKTEIVQFQIIKNSQKSAKKWEKTNIRILLQITCWCTSRCSDVSCLVRPRNSQPELFNSFNAEALHVTKLSPGKKANTSTPSFFHLTWLSRIHTAFLKAWNKQRKICTVSRDEIRQEILISILLIS